MLFEKLKEMENQDYLLKQIEIMGKVLKELIGRMIPLTVKECEEEIKELEEKGELPPALFKLIIGDDDEINTFIKNNDLSSENTTLLLEYLIILAEKSKEEKDDNQLEKYQKKVKELAKVSSLAFETIIRINNL